MHDQSKYISNIAPITQDLQASLHFVPCNVPVYCATMVAYKEES